MGGRRQRRAGLWSRYPASVATQRSQKLHRRAVRESRQADKLAAVPDKPRVRREFSGRARGGALLDFEFDGVLIGLHKGCEVESLSAALAVIKSAPSSPASLIS